MSDPAPDPTPEPRHDEQRAQRPDDQRAERPPVVDFHATARRLRWILGVIGSAVVALFVVRGIVDGAFEPRLLAELLGIGVLLAFAVEVVVVGGAALRGMLTAGERGDRLASDDVALLPPQLRRGRRR